MNRSRSSVSSGSSNAENVPGQLNSTTQSFPSVYLRQMNDDLANLNSSDIYNEICTKFSQNEGK